MSSYVGRGHDDTHVVEQARTPASGVSSSPRSRTLQPTSRKRRHSAAEKTSSSTTHEYGFMRDTGGRDATRFVGSGSGIHFVRRVYLRLAQTRKSAATASPNDFVPGEDDQFQQSPASAAEGGSEASLWRDEEVLDASNSNNNCNDPPSFDQLVRWSRSYFASWHPIYPFLYAPEVLHSFETISNVGVDAIDPLDRAIVRAIISISLADRRQGNANNSPFLARLVPSSLIFRTIGEAMATAQFALCQSASIRATQAALSIQLFLLSFLRLNSASRLGGLLVRMAFHLGLHRCPSRFPFFTAHEAQLRRRVFWSIYSIERFLCQSLGLPLDIRDDDIDVCYPGEELHATTLETDNKNQLVLLRYVAKHARIRGLILELRNKTLVNRHDTSDDATFVQAELIRWSNEIQDAIDEVEAGNYEDEDQDQDSQRQPHPTLTSSHCVFLSLLKYESLISLNRPVITSDPSQALYSAALQNCISAAKSISTTIKRHRMAGTSPSSSQFLWPTFTWSVWISAFVLIYATFEQQLAAKSALRHIEYGKAVLRHLAVRGTMWPEYCLAAIDELAAAIGDLSKPAEQTDSEPSSIDRTHTIMLPPPALTQFPQSEPTADRQAESRSGYQNQETADMSIPGEENLPSENQESLLWYDQLFSSAFSALESPFLAAAQFDSSVDPTWSYLR